MCENVQNVHVYRRRLENISLFLNGCEIDCLLNKSGCVYICFITYIQAKLVQTFVYRLNIYIFLIQLYVVSSLIYHKSEVLAS